MPRDLFAKQEEPKDLLAEMTPQQEVVEKQKGPFTPEEKGQLQSDVLHFLWPGKEEATRQFIKGTGTALGLGVAAGATALAPTPLSPALGYAAGERLGRTLETITGVSKPETFGESALATAEDIGIGLLPYGIQKTVGAVSKIPKMATQPWTQKGKIKEVFKTVGGELEPSIAGESGLTGAKQQYATLSKQGNQLYESWKKLIPTDTKAPLNNLYSSVDNILKDPASTDAEKAFANKILERVSIGMKGKMWRSPEQALGVMERAEETGQLAGMIKPSTIEEAYTTRSMLSEQTKKGGKVGWRAGEMLDALHQDLNETANKLGIPEVTEGAQKAIDFWRSKVIPQREAVKMIEKRSVEKIPDLLRTDIKTAQKVINAMPPERVQDLKRGLITDISTKAKDNPIQTGKRLRDLMSSRKEVMETVFDREELEAIRLSSDPTKLGKYFEEHPKTKWLARFLGYGAMYGTLGYGAIRRLFHTGP